eukprot:scaffold78463_cov28-Tisochrysis_lutea.AAC.1
MDENKLLGSHVTARFLMCSKLIVIRAASEWVLREATSPRKGVSDGPPARARALLEGMPQGERERGAEIAGHAPARVRCPLPPRSRCRWGPSDWRSSRGGAATIFKKIEDR